LGCSAAGVLLLLGAGGGIGAVAASGVALALGAAVAYALYLTAAQGLPRDLDLILLSAIVCTSAAGTLGVAGAVTGTLHLPARPTGWLWIALLAVFSTVLPMICVFAGVRAVGAPTAAILSCAEPAVTVALTAAVYGERLTVVQFAGGVAVVAAVAALQLRPRRRTPAVLQGDRSLLHQRG
jgi:drug/metabolite transporter (DMT)-like permease